MDKNRPLTTVTGNLDLTDLLHRLSFTYQLITPIPYQVGARAQAGFLNELAGLKTHVERNEAVLYCADAAHPSHNTRCTRARCAVGQEHPLLTAHTDKARTYIVCACVSRLSTPPSTALKVSSTQPSSTSSTGFPSLAKTSPSA